mmetsp:Transcript_5413/g.6569  ORF Transcript_5413/g.6569 Transcript_5413/m.6569 type:complete len:97 (-) Transcript_5413:482-772(-)
MSVNDSFGDLLLSKEGTLSRVDFELLSRVNESFNPRMDRSRGTYLVPDVVYLFGGRKGPMFAQFVHLSTTAFLEVRKHFSLLSAMYKSVWISCNFM